MRTLSFIDSHTWTRSISHKYCSGEMVVVALVGPLSADTDEWLCIGGSNEGLLSAP